MHDRREPILMCATGKKGVGKTYTTMRLIEDYTKPNKKTGKKARKVLIYDINMEYTEFKAISVKDIKKQQGKGQGKTRKARIIKKVV
jgi:hypothetical protein